MGSRHSKSIQFVFSTLSLELWYNLTFATVWFTSKTIISTTRKKAERLLEHNFKLCSPEKLTFWDNSNLKTFFETTGLSKIAKWWQNYLKTYFGISKSETINSLFYCINAKVTVYFHNKIKFVVNIFILELSQQSVEYSIGISYYDKPIVLCFKDVKHLLWT